MKIAGGGSVDPDGYRFLDVAGSRRDEGRARSGVAAELRRRRARGRSSGPGSTLAELGFVCPLHTKRSMFDALLAELGMREDQAVYLDDTGHMSGVDPLLGLDRAVRDGRAARRRRRAAAVGRDRLHVGGNRRALGRAA